MVLIKICGITNLEDAQAAVELGANALGFNFYERSPRYIVPARAREIVAQMAPQVLCVGVFVNEERTAVERIVAESNVTVAQLHGDESPAYCAELAGWPVIKALRVGDDHWRLLLEGLDSGQPPDAPIRKVRPATGIAASRSGSIWPAPRPVSSFRPASR